MFCLGLAGCAIVGACASGGNPLAATSGVLGCVVPSYTAVQEQKLTEVEGNS